MLDNVELWIDVAATAADAFLLTRILQLRLQRVYLFITLICVMGLFFDGVQLWFGLKSSESERIFIYSRFLYAFLYPLAAWDALEEMPPAVLQMRRIAIGRLITGLVFAAIFGFVVTLVVSGDDTQFVLSSTLAIILWAGSSASTFMFLWSLQRAIKAQQTPRPTNTYVWMTFYQLALIAELVACFGGVLASFANDTVRGILDICLLTYGLVITVWCGAKLRRVSSDVPTPASAGAS